MKSKYTIVFLLLLGIYTNGTAQDKMPHDSIHTRIIKESTVAYAANFATKANYSETKDTSASPSDEPLKTCSLVKNKWNERKITTSKKGYKLVTTNGDEVLSVKEKDNGTEKIEYESDTEVLKYKKNKNGEVKYTYKFIDGCEKVKVKKDKNGFVKTSKNSYQDLFEVRENAEKAITRGAVSCGVN